MGTFLKIFVREGITKRFAGETFECLTAPFASLTSVGLCPLGSTKVALDPTKRNNPEMKKIYQPDLQKSNYFESFLQCIHLYNIHTNTSATERFNRHAIRKGK